MHTFFKQDGTVSYTSARLYSFVAEYIEKTNLHYAKKALELAINFHNGNFRDGGEPYIIHPLRVAQIIILLNIKNSNYKINKRKLNNKILIEKQTLSEYDELISVALLHDVIEDVLKEKGHELVTKYGFSENIFSYIKILSKDKSNPSFTLEDYFYSLLSHWIPLLVKLADRLDNCSTMYMFDYKRRQKYLAEIKDYIYPLCENGEIRFPEYSYNIHLLHYQIKCICNTAEHLEH